jgi:PAS domain S-box-containing protein
VCRVLGEHLHAHRVQYAEIIDGTEVLISHEYLNGLPSLRGHQPVAAYGAEVVAAFRRGEPLIIDDVATDPRVPAAARSAFAAAGVTSTIATSLIKGGRWVATLAVDMRTPRHWTAADVALLQETAERTGDAVERARAAAALRASEARLRRALEIETVGVIFFKTTGEITHANEAFLRLSGYTAEDQERGLVRWDAMTPPEYVPASLNAVQEFTRCGRTTPYEKEYIRKDGSRWWALFAATRIDEATGVEYIVDITERKRAEAEWAFLLAREQETRQAAERAAERTQRLQSVTAALATALTSDQVADVIITQGLAALTRRRAGLLLTQPARVVRGAHGDVGVESWGCPRHTSA